MHAHAYHSVHGLVSNPCRFWLWAGVSLVPMAQHFTASYTTPVTHDFQGRVGALSQGYYKILPNMTQQWHLQLSTTNPQRKLDLQAHLMPPSSLTTRGQINLQRHETVTDTHDSSPRAPSVLLLLWVQAWGNQPLPFRSCFHSVTIQLVSVRSKGERSFHF